MRPTPGCHQRRRKPTAGWAGAPPWRVVVCVSATSPATRDVRTPSLRHFEGLMRPSSMRAGVRAGGALIASQCAGLALRLLGGSGCEFDTFGRVLGVALLPRSVRLGAEYLINPVSSYRYFEFPFVARDLPDGAARCLDVASPRLFSLWALRTHRVSSVMMINPDARDLESTRVAASAARVTPKLSCERVEDHQPPRDGYDCIWSISVVEHIHGDEADVAAVARMMSMLPVGGRLLITLPVDREFRREFRCDDVYGLQDGGKSQQFFQRVCDEKSISRRILRGAGRAPVASEWFGEFERGTFESYELRWRERGIGATATDAWTFMRRYRTYPSWTAMPRHGVLGLVFERT